MKITDFGFATFYDPKKGASLLLGSPLYMAPEIIQEHQYDYKVDIWSIGVIAYVLLSGRPPFHGKNKDEIFNNIKNGELKFDPFVWNKVSPSAINFINLALEKDQYKRVSSKELIEHEWLKE